MAPRVIVVAAIAAAAILSATFAAPRADCPDGCKCYRDWLNCSYVGYEQPPPGPWPDADTLWFAGNNITTIGDGFFSEFPSLHNIYLDENLLSVLDFKAFLGLNLRKLRIQENIIAEILSAGVEFSELSELDLTSNKLSSIDSDLFLAFPSLKTLTLNDNPIVYPPGQPFLSHPQLAYLYLAHTNAADGLSEETFQKTPNLSELSLLNSSVPSFAGAFRELNSLTYLYLQDNRLTSVDVGELPTSGRLRWLDVSRNPLVRFDPAALDGSIKAGYVMITDTPLACSCGFEDLYRWAKEDKTWLTAYCAGEYDFCGFD